MSRRTEVDMFEWKKATKDAVLVTEGLGPCVGIAIHDKATQIGHLGHFVAPHEDKFEVNRMFTSALTGASDPACLNVYVRGGAVDLELGEYDLVAYTTESRRFVVARLAELGLAAVDLRWSDSNEIVNMELDCNSGICEISVSEVEL